MLNYPPSSMSEGSGRGRGRTGGLGSSGPCGVEGLRLGGNLLLRMSSDLPRPRLVCALDGGGLGGNIPFCHLRDCLIFHFESIEKSGMGLEVPGWRLSPRALVGEEEREGVSNSWYCLQFQLMGTCESFLLSWSGAVFFVFDFHFGFFVCFIFCDFIS